MLSCTVHPSLHSSLNTCDCRAGTVFLSICCIVISCVSLRTFQICKCSHTSISISKTMYANTCTSQTPACMYTRTHFCLNSIRQLVCQCVCPLTILTRRSNILSLHIQIATIRVHLFKQAQHVHIVCTCLLYTNV